jgi:hypothetical protein
MKCNDASVEPATYDSEPGGLNERLAPPLTQSDKNGL